MQLFDYYYRHGFSQVELEFEQHPDPLDPNRIDIDVRVHEGNPFYVNHVLISGLHYTKPQVVDKLMEIKPGDPLTATQFWTRNGDSITWRCSAKWIPAL